MKLNFLTVALVSAGVLTVPALAYAGPGADQVAPASAAADTSAAPAQSTSERKIQDVIVTAQKRPQSSSKVSVSLAVVDTESLKDKGVTSAADLTELVPNVQIGGGNFNSMEITIRGIGSSSNSYLSEAEAAFNIDGISLARSQGAGATFFDLERVEVLRGPQGTLYGKNANAGAINVVTKKPGSKLEGAVETEIGNYKSHKVNAMVNLPVNDALALRAVVSSIKHDGYTDDTVLKGGPVIKADDMNNKSGRVGALLKFSPSASWFLSYDTSHSKGVGPAVFALAPNGTVADDKNVTTLLAPHIDTTNKGITSELKVGLGDANLTYLFGRRVSTDDLLASVPTASINYLALDEYKQTSHEVRLNSAGTGQLQWVTGLYYSKESGRVDEPVYLAGAAPYAVLAMPPSVCGPTPCWELETFHHQPIFRDSKAVFGQATYAVANDWRVIAGVRYNKDSKERYGETVMFKGLQPTVIHKAAIEGSKVTYKLAVEHDLSASQMAYLSLATGYKGGGFNEGNTISPATPGYNPNLYYQPETITSLEGGVKGRFLDGKVRLGASAYYYNYTNLQVTALLDLTLLTKNAAKAKVQGVEVEGVGLVSRNGRINFGLGLQSAKYDQYTTAGGTDFSGHALDRAPSATLTLGYTHDWELDGGRLFSASAGTRYTSSYNLTDPGNASKVNYGAISFVQPSATKSDVVLSYSGKEESWKLQAFVKNIEDKRAMASLTAASKTSEDVLLTDPRTFGLRLNLKF